MEETKSGRSRVSSVCIGEDSHEKDKNLLRIVVSACVCSAYRGQTDLFAPSSSSRQVTTFFSGDGKAHQYKCVAGRRCAHFRQAHENCDPRPCGISARGTSISLFKHERTYSSHARIFSSSTYTHIYIYNLLHMYAHGSPCSTW